MALVNFRPDAGTCSPTVAIADANGELSVEWTTTKYSKTLAAHIVDKEGTDIDKATLDVKIKKEHFCPDDNHPHAIDLGLSVKWACCNVGASVPEGYGGYYAWGETEEKSDYDWDTYKYHDNSKSWINIGSNISGTQYDVAHVKWGGSWRMPTLDKIKELLNKCTWKWTSQNGVNGQLVTGPNGNSIFLPATGERDGTDFSSCGSVGCYWSATLHEDYSNYAYCLFFNDGVHN